MKLYQLDKFGQELSNLRKKRNLTQDNVYDLIGISPDTLRRIENGYSIPKLETIELLSIAYKVDVHNILAKYRISYKYIFSDDLENINKLIMSNELKNIDKYIENIQTVVCKENSKSNYDLILIKLTQFKETIELFSLYKSMKEDDLVPIIDKIYEVLQLSIKDFDIMDVHTYNYDYVEMRLLLLLCEIFRKTNQFNRCKFTLFALEENVKDVLKYNKDFYEVMLKIYFHQSTFFFRIDKFDRSIEAANKGIETSKQINDCAMMPRFLARLSASYYLLGDLTTAKKYHNLARNHIELYGNEQQSERHINLVKKFYPKLIE